MEEDEIWDYKPIKRSKKEDNSKKKVTIKATIQGQKSSSKKKTNSSAKESKKKKIPDKSCNSSQSKQRKSKTSNTQEKTPTKPQGFCPSCQVPFECLGILSPAWHVRECLELLPSDLKECPLGLDCDNTIESHFQQYSHNELALARSRSSDAREDNTAKNGSKSARSKLEFPDRGDTCAHPVEEENVTDKISTDKDDGGVFPLLKSRQKNADKCESEIKKFEISQNPNAGSQTSPTLNKQVGKEGLVGDSEEICSKARQNELGESESDILSSQRSLEDMLDDIPNDSDSCDEEEIAPKNSQEIPVHMSKDNDILEEIVDTNLQNTTTNIPNDNDNCVGDKKKVRNTETQEDHTICLSSDEEPELSQPVCGTPLSQKWQDIFSCPKNSTEVFNKSQKTPKSSEKKKKSSERKDAPSKQIVTPKRSVSSEKKSIRTGPSPPKKSKSADQLSSLSVPFSNNLVLQKSLNKQTSLTSFFNKERNAINTTSNSAVVIQDPDSEVISGNNLKSKAKKGSNLPLSAKAVHNLRSLRQKVDDSQMNCRNNNTVNECKNSQSEGMSQTTEVNIVKKSDNEDSGGVDMCTQIQSNLKSTEITLKVKQTTSESTSNNNIQSTSDSKPSAIDILMSKKSRPNSSVKPIPVEKPSENVVPMPTEESNTHKKRQCPFYKKIPDTGFTVDAFSYGDIPGCSSYFLSHFHYDHYGGLKKSFSKPLYCSQITANLVTSRIKVNTSYVHALPVNKPCIVGGVEVTFLDANHCPGSVLILFKLKSGRTFLHTGDFRADPSMELLPSLNGLSVDQLYLDTTYCDPSYAFPPQQEVIQFTVELVLSELKRNPGTLIVCGSYTIGKERIFMAISEALKCKVCVLKEKMNVLECLEDAQLRNKLSLNFNDSSLHVLPMAKLNPTALRDHAVKLQNKHQNIIALEPTGWSFSKISSLQQIKPKFNRDGIKIYGIPYSEHSSYLELQRFVQFIKPKRIIPTVNVGNPASRKKMEGIFRSWEKSTPTVKKKNKIKQSSLNAWM